MKHIVGIAALAGAAAWIAVAEQPAGEAGKQKPPEMNMEKLGPVMYQADKIVWQDGPGSLPPGAKLAVLEGDPAKDGPFTMRAVLPDGYRIPPHWHPKVEHVTVISGTFRLGMGEKFDESAMQDLPTGAFAHWPAGMRHFAAARGETVLQIHGVGPWGINYVNPADDPRSTAKK